MVSHYKINCFPYINNKNLENKTFSKYHYSSSSSKPIKYLRISLTVYLYELWTRKQWSILCKETKETQTNGEKYVYRPGDILRDVNFLLTEQWILHSQSENPKWKYCWKLQSGLEVIWKCNQMMQRTGTVLGVTSPGWNKTMEAPRREVS